MPLNIDFIKYLLKCSNKAPEPGPFLILADVKMCMSLAVDTALGLNLVDKTRWRWALSTSQ